MLTNHNQKWITDTDFKGLTSLNLFRKENAPPVQTSHREDLKNRHMIIRKKFAIEQIEQIKQNAEKIYIYITADDYYKLYINEKYVGQGPAPAYHFRYNMNQYDITDFLEYGENIIAVHVYYQGLVNRVWNSGDYRMGMTAQIISGTQILLSTDSSWKYETAHEFIGQKTIGYETQFIEDIDNRNKIADWKSIAYDDSDWSNVSVNEQIDYTFFMQETPPLQVYRIQPANITEITDKKYIIDFGQEITGRLLMSAKGNAGDIIKIGYGEELESPESPQKVKSKMRCNCDYNEKWILSGKYDTDTLEPYDYKAFRYVEISLENSEDRESAEIILSSVCAEVRHYPFDETAVYFQSSNNLLNSIWEICKNGVKYGTQEGYLDCPSREKGQYLGDATVVALSHAYLTGDYRMYKKCLIDFAQSSYICPGIMATSPGSWMQEIADYSLQYPLQLLNYYRLSGDTDLLLQLLPIAEGIIRYFKQFTRTDGLIEDYKDKPVLVDWPSNLRDNYDYELMPKYQDGCNTVLNAFYIGAIQTINEIKAMLKIPHCENETENLKQSFIAAFFDDNTKLFTDSEASRHSSLHANALPLFYNLVPSENKENKIIDFIKQKRLSCGVYFAYFVLKALAKAGEYDFVFELLVSQDEHSWGNMVKEGATTCFEAWGKDQKWNTSLCHPWASTPIIILIEDIIGNPQCNCEKYMKYEIKTPSFCSSIL